MRVKAAIVERQQGHLLPDLQTIRERLNRLHDPDYCLSEAHQAQLWSGAADQGDSALVGFASTFIKKGAQLGIPLVAERFTVTTVELYHAQWRNCLPADDWAILAYIGRQVRARLSPQLDIRWAAEAPLIQPFVGDRDDFVSAFDPAKWVLVV